MSNPRKVFTTMEMAAVLGVPTYAITKACDLGLFFPDFQGPHGPLFLEGRESEIKSALELPRSSSCACPPLLTCRQLENQLGLKRMQVNRAIKSGAISPDFIGNNPASKCPKYYFLPENLDRIRWVFEPVACGDFSEAVDAETNTATDENV